MSGLLRFLRSSINLVTLVALVLLIFLLQQLTRNSVGDSLGQDQTTATVPEVLAASARGEQTGYRQAQVSPQPTPTAAMSDSLWDLKLDSIDEEASARRSTKEQMIESKSAEQAAPAPTSALPTPVAQPAIRAASASTPPAAPVSQPSPSGPGFWYTVQSGDSLSTIANLYETTVYAILQANTVSNPNLIRAGQQLWIPGTQTGAPTSVQPPPDLGCPSSLDAYPAWIALYLNTASPDVNALRAQLRTCGVVTDSSGAVRQHALEGTEARDYVVAIHELTVSARASQGMLLIYHWTQNGYELVTGTASVGEIGILLVDDVNADGRREIVWTDTYCGPYTCYSTLHVDQWNGVSYLSWILDEPQTVQARYTVKDTDRNGSGREILIHSNVVPEGASSSLARTEIYASLGGGPYSRIGELVYEPSACFYYQIFAVEPLFAVVEVEATPIATASPTPTSPNDPPAATPYDPVIDAYESLLAIMNPTTCLTLPDEIELLRNFVLFRLALVYSAADQTDEAIAVRNLILQPDLQLAADRFLEEYSESGSLVTACTAVTDYAIAHPVTWQFLADWGLREIDFTPTDLCPFD